MNTHLRNLNVFVSPSEILLFIAWKIIYLSTTYVQHAVHDIAYIFFFKNVENRRKWPKINSQVHGILNIVIWECSIFLFFLEKTRYAITTCCTYVVDRLIIFHLRCRRACRFKYFSRNSRSCVIFGAWKETKTSSTRSIRLSSNRSCARKSRYCIKSRGWWVVLKPNWLN